MYSMAYTLYVHTAYTEKSYRLIMQFISFRLLVAIVAYIVVGMLVMRYYKGARGIEMIPNLSFWKDFPFLLKVKCNALYTDLNVLFIQLINYCF